MSWATLPPEVRALAERVCTEKELAALKLWDAGAGYRRVGLMLDISTSTARDRVQRALGKLARAKDEG
ncbi:MAG: hypothetical protein M3364_09745 [Actinomycetota bacterium]|nr:hypothetical protein [Actinomycetota bacterium]